MSSPDENEAEIASYDTRRRRRRGFHNHSCSLAAQVAVAGMVSLRSPDGSPNRRLLVETHNLESERDTGRDDVFRRLSIDIAVFEFDPLFGRQEKAGQQVEQSHLARTIRSNDAEQRSVLPDVKIISAASFSVGGGGSLMSHRLSNDECRATESPASPTIITVLSKQIYR
jgi:hypothetical protein